MAKSHGNSPPCDKSPGTVSGDDSDEDDVMEESPCGRYLKRREEVQQRDVPGMDSAYLAMDTEEGVEVVWNEVKFSERKDFKSQEEKIRQVFNNLTQLEHPNIIKFHKYWIDHVNEKPRVVFVTEYMSSGSLKQFLKRTKRNVKKLPLQAWKRWCIQILSALSYLHSCSPPIIHGDLNCDTIFIQHNGPVKIGSVAPDAIHYHVKTCRNNMTNMYFVAPEYGNSGPMTPAMDIYSFGWCALEMATFGIYGMNGDRDGCQSQGNPGTPTSGSSQNPLSLPPPPSSSQSAGGPITEEHLNRTLASLENPLQQDLIRQCLQKEPKLRPSARQLLFHPILFEVHSLKLLAAHALLRSARFTPESVVDEAVQKHYGPEKPIAEISHPDGRTGVTYTLADIPVIEKLEKFIEDVKFGIYPLTAFALSQGPLPRTRATSPESSESVKSSDSPVPKDVENRRIINMMCNVKSTPDRVALSMTILLRMDDNMNRQLTCDVMPNETAAILANELVHYGLINEADLAKLVALIDDTLKNYIPGVSNLPMHHSPVIPVSSLYQAPMKATGS
ncbi:unnamed protein product [Darwinula stevensoni]|uniref:Protein kinase domain-containing protein n=1 Tax=Darwinula stevensoni TaxID=69355 RepID=A0A7R8X082_9CRUS|nr:unnamed protein product [Darwinula stevensoni]CAG0880838.1 unnamed protein product [Darwinula stevensoni]